MIKDLLSDFQRKSYSQLYSMNKITSPLHIIQVNLFASEDISSDQ